MVCGVKRHRMAGLEGTNAMITAYDLTLARQTSTNPDDPRLVVIRGGPAGGPFVNQEAVLVDRKLAGALAADLKALDGFMDHLLNGPNIEVARCNVFGVPEPERRLLAILGHGAAANVVEDAFEAFEATEQALAERLPGWAAYQSGER